MSSLLARHTTNFMVRYCWTLASIIMYSIYQNSATTRILWLCNPVRLRETDLFQWEWDMLSGSFHVIYVLLWLTLFQSLSGSLCTAQDISGSQNSSSRKLVPYKFSECRLPSEDSLTMILTSSLPCPPMLNFVHLCSGWVHPLVVNSGWALHVLYSG